MKLGRTERVPHPPTPRPLGAEALLSPPTKRSDAASVGVFFYGGQAAPAEILSTVSVLQYPLHLVRSAVLGPQPLDDPTNGDDTVQILNGRGLY
jgi:hypothetical protein